MSDLWIRLGLKLLIFVVLYGVISVTVRALRNRGGPGKGGLPPWEPPKLSDDKPGHDPEPPGKGHGAMTAEEFAERARDADRAAVEEARAGEMPPADRVVGRTVPDSPPQADRTAAEYHAGSSALSRIASPRSRSV